MNRNGIMLVLVLALLVACGGAFYYMWQDGSNNELDSGGNKAAVFKDPVDGAAAQFDLMNRAYTGKTLAKAIEKWSGGNNSADYVARIARETGLDPNAPLTADVLKSDRGLALAKAMAKWEAGRE